jgi:hypothetical protein
VVNFDDERASVKGQAMSDKEFDLLCIAITRLPPQRRKVLIPAVLSRVLYPADRGRVGYLPPDGLS